jgi:hypothetical protein
MADRRTRASFRFLMGVGLDSDGHARVTRGEDYVLVGGSEGTHGRMQEDVERFRENLRSMGTDLQSATGEEMLEAAERARLRRQ